MNEESVKQALYHGIRSEVLAIEKYQFIMNYKLNRPVKIREAGIVNHLFWLGDSLDGVIFNKRKFKKLTYVRSNALTIKEIYPLQVLLLAKHFILPLLKIKKHI